MRRYCASVFLLVLLVAVPPRAQHKLAVDSEFKIGQRSTGNMEPVRCDDQGNIYVRFLAGAIPTRSPIVRISPDGPKHAVFDALAAPERQKWIVTDFYPSDRGEVYELAQDPDGKSYLLRYSADGTLKSTSLIGAPGIVLVHFVILPNDTFFANGKTYGQEADGKTHITPFAGIFNLDGELLRKIVVDKASKAKSLHPPNEPEISLGSAVADSEGNVYVTKASTPVKVYVISLSYS